MSRDRAAISCAITGSSTPCAMEACYKTAHELYDELASKNAEFKTIYESWLKFREEQYLWFRVAENTFDNFVYSMRKPVAGGKPK